MTNKIHHLKSMISFQSMYGALSAIEGCEAFEDAKHNTKIMKWYGRMQEEVKNHTGGHPLNKKTT